MIDLFGLCSICGKAGPMNTCHLCGKLVCSNCFENQHGVCNQCHVGKI